MRMFEAHNIKIIFDDLVRILVEFERLLKIFSKNSRDGTCQIIRGFLLQDKILEAINLRDN